MQLPSPWKQWGGAETLREKDNANPHVFNAFVVLVVLVVISLLLATIRNSIYSEIITKEDIVVVVNLWSVVVAFSGRDLKVFKCSH